MEPIKREPFRWRSTISYKTVDKIVTRGYDTTELVEKGYGLADVIFVDFQARIPLINEAKMLNYLMILCLDEGLSSPAAISRLAAKGQNISTQCVGSSILAFGHAYGAFQSYGRMLQKYLRRYEKEEKGLDELAEILVRENENSLILGVSNLMLKDPAARRVFARADALEVSGKHIEFQKKIVKAVQKRSKEPVDLDMFGAVGTAMFDLGFSPEATWAVVAITRAFGCGAHAIEEEEREPRIIFGQSMTPRENYDGPAERPVPSLKYRDAYAQPAQTKTLAEWKNRFERMKPLKGSGFSIVEDV